MRRIMGLAAMMIGASIFIDGHRIGTVTEVGGTESGPVTRRERTRPRYQRSGNYSGQSPEQAQAALDAAEAKRLRRIARNKRIAGEVV